MTTNDTLPKKRKDRSRSLLIFGTVVLIAGLIGGVAIFVASGWFAPEVGPGCTAEDEAVAANLNSLTILDESPEATLEDQEFGCDPDSGYAYALRTFRSTKDIESIVDFYRGAARVDGWSLESEGKPTTGGSGQLIGEAARLCFSKMIQTKKGFLSVIFHHDLGDGDANGNFDLVVKASRHRLFLCA